jgi:hypothetical protein
MTISPTRNMTQKHHHCRIDKVEQGFYPKILHIPNRPQNKEVLRCHTKLALTKG